MGATTLLAVNATAGRDRWRRGGAVHLGNILSVGATRGDGHWTWYVASDRLADKLVGALEASGFGGGPGGDGGHGGELLTTEERR